jgi:hypothetical protein
MAGKSDSLNSTIGEVRFLKVNFISVVRFVLMGNLKVRLKPMRSL